MKKKFSNNQLEEIAVSEINYRIARPQYNLRSEIKSGDKGISFDGNIEVFKNNSQTIESRIGIVPVQVKGTQVENFSGNTRSFSLEMGHYRNYYEEGGVLLLVVEIKPNGEDSEAKIFYKQLLSQELKNILNVSKNQKKKAVQLRALSETNISIVCRKFIVERDKQPKSLLEYDFGEKNFDSYELRSLTYNPEKLETKNIFDHYFNMYGIMKGQTPDSKPLMVPLDHFKFDSLATEGQQNVTIGENTYNFNIRRIRKADKTLVIMENVLYLEHTPKRKESPFQFKVRRFGSLTSQKKILPFLIDLLQGNMAKFPDGHIQLNGQSSQLKEGLKEITVIYDLIREFENVYKYLNINESVDLQDKEGEFYNTLNQLYGLNQAINHKKYDGFTFSNPTESSFVTYNVGGKEVVLFYNAQSEEKIINGINKDIQPSGFMFQFQNTKRQFEHTPYWLVNSKTLIESLNSDFDIVKDTFNQFDPYLDDDVFGITNEFCLHYLNLYDQLGNEKILDLVNYIYDKYDSDTKGESEIVLINKMQINLRKNNNLSDNEKEKLIELKFEHPQKHELQFCINVLLGNIAEADYHFKKFSEETISFYEGLPIYTLYTRLKELVSN